MIALHSNRYRGFTLIEATISIVILGSSILAGLAMFGSYVGGIATTADQMVARELAADLIAEIIAQPFEDVSLAPGSFGRGAGETTRADFDDVDDYDNWVENPPEAEDGTPLGGSEYSGFARSVTVQNVDDNSLDTVVTDGSSAVKRIIVTVTRHAKRRAELIAFRTRNDATE